MNRIAVVILTALFGGCYTQLQLANKETTAGPPDVLPNPIVIIRPIYPFPLPHPCPPPRPVTPTRPIAILPAEQVEVSPAKEDRIRTTGATRDEHKRTNREGNTGHGRQ